MNFLNFFSLKANLSSEKNEKAYDFAFDKAPILHTFLKNPIQGHYLMLFFIITSSLQTTGRVTRVTKIDEYAESR